MPFISSVDVNMKSEFRQDETLIAVISGDFYETVSQGDITFLTRGHVVTSIPYTIMEIDDDFFVYAQLKGKEPGNYSLLIEDARFYESKELVEEDIIKNFTISSEQAPFTIDPGFVYTAEDFSLELESFVSLDLEIKIQLEVGFENLVLPEVYSFNLEGNNVRKIDFEIKEYESINLTYIKFSTSDYGNFSYEIPAYVLVKGVLPETKQISFDNSVIDVSISTNSETERLIKLKNPGKTSVQNISLLVSSNLEPFIELSTYEIDEIPANSSKLIFVYVASGDEPLKINGEIVAISKNAEFSTNAIVFLDFIPEFIPLDENGEPIENIPDKSSELCEDLGGLVCSEGQTCSGERNIAKDGICCLGICEETKESNSGKIIGWAIITLIIIGVVWFYFKRYNRQLKSVDFFKFGKKKR